MENKWIETLLWRFQGEVLSKQTIEMIANDINDYLNREKPEFFERNLAITE